MLAFALIGNGETSIFVLPVLSASFLLCARNATQRNFAFVRTTTLAHYKPLECVLCILSIRRVQPSLFYMYALLYLLHVSALKYR